MSAAHPVTESRTVPTPATASATGRYSYPATGPYPVPATSPHTTRVVDPTPHPEGTPA
ncbi:hypothetical protein [Streptomyces sp. NPDC050355]|uniref:Serine protease n=1 Tax=Streptomyces sirii TaxID=3127701 RepID=A0ABZ2QKI2_9ACTN